MISSYLSLAADWGGQTMISSYLSLAADWEIRLEPFYKHLEVKTNQTP
jgi:hypothetical protein